MKLAKGFLRSLLVALPLITSAAQTEIIIESAPDGQHSDWFQVVEGNWMESASKSKAPGLTATKAMFKTAGPTAGAARFVPDIPIAGKYEVFATYPDSGNAKGVIYKVHSAEGDKEIVIDQRGRDAAAKPPSNTWFSLGTYHFSQGRDGYVEVRDPQTGLAANEKEPNVRVYADAVRFVPVGFELPPQFAAKSGQEAPKAAEGLPPGLPAAPTGAPMPKLASAVPTASSALPSLDQAGGQKSTPPSSSAGTLPPLSAVQSSGESASQATPAAGGPALPSLNAASASLPPASPVASSAAQQLPSLSSLSTAQAPSQLPGTAGTPALPQLSAGTSALTPPPGTGLPPSPEGQPATPGLMSLSAVSDQTQAPPLPPIPSPASSGMPLPPLETSAATPSLPALAGTPTPLGGESGAAKLPSTQLLPTPVPAALPPQPASMPTVSSPPTLPPVPSVAAPAPVGGAPSGSNLPWVYDEGSAHAASRNTGKKVLVFFFAPGNTVADKYEKEFFPHPAVQATLNKFVLLKVNFPQNTKAGYKLQIFGAGNIAVTDAYGQKIGAITQLPATPEELASQLETLAGK
ncbi:Minus agglutinin [Candidatus Sumerlaea chitinivorans]|uniref:Minus agglutinin n=1 Tax=Sumerlaea chitinivorans TaxID=2250252 RepID=A0A2Z4Y4P8_SUMC1|nr:Minus agglutinin [Candidatus Sumerlaea chitinivorans]